MLSYDLLPTYITLHFSPLRKYSPNAIILAIFLLVIAVCVTLRAWPFNQTAILKFQLILTIVDFIILIQGWQQLSYVLITFNNNRIMGKPLALHIVSVPQISQLLCECYIPDQGGMPSQHNTLRQGENLL
jgi:hypothetical protein